MRRLFKSPMHVCLIGVLVLSVGINSVVRLVSELIRGEPEFSLEFFAIFIGLGILRGSSNYRSFLGALLALNLVFAGAVFIILPVIWLFGGGEDQGGLFLAVGVCFLVIGYFFKALWDAKNDPWFSVDRDKKAPPFLIPVTILLTVFYSVAIEVKDYSWRRDLAEIFRYDLDIKVMNAETGELIRNISITHPSSNFDETEVPDWMKGSRGGNGSSGNSYHLDGYSKGPFNFSVSAEGFERVVVDVNRFTESPIEVRLSPEQISNDEGD